MERRVVLEQSSGVRMIQGVASVPMYPANLTDRDGTIIATLVRVEPRYVLYKQQQADTASVPLPKV